jgi:hypothetical protein
MARMQDRLGAVTFGSLTATPSVAQLQQIHGSLSEIGHLKPIVEAVRELPTLWERLCARDPELRLLRGDLAANKLVEWVSRGSLYLVSQSEDVNTVTMPVTIVGHLCHYLSYLSNNPSDSISHAEVRQRVTDTGGGIQGFCAGLLSALAVAGARDEDQIGTLGAISIRVAFAIGVYIDVDRIKNGETGCLALRWKSPETLMSIQTAIARYDGVRNTQHLKLHYVNTDG